MKLSCIIIDDELKSRENLKMMINEFCTDVSISSTFSNIYDAISFLENNKTDIVFLDIQLQNETGFDFLEKINLINFEIIFTTAFSEYAIKAFKYSAIDYLLKPIDIGDLRRSIDKARNNLKKVDSAINQNNNTTTNTSKSRLALPTTNGLLFVNLMDIIYCEADGNYTIFHIRDNVKHIVAKTLKEYEDLLNGNEFFRIHNTYLVNLKEVKQYIRGEGGQVILSNGITLDVAKRRKEEFLRMINK